MRNVVAFLIITTKTANSQYYKIIELAIREPVRNKPLPFTFVTRIFTTEASHVALRRQVTKVIVP
jgi:hypothetical protein